MHDHLDAEKGSGSTTDPVCGMTVDPATTPHIATHSGEHHYFCSADCLANFEADPDRYFNQHEIPLVCLRNCSVKRGLGELTPFPLCGMMASVRNGHLGTLKSSCSAAA